MTLQDGNGASEKAKFLTRGVEEDIFTKGPNLFSYSPVSIHRIKLISGKLGADATYEKVKPTQNGITIENNYNLSYKIVPEASIGLTDDSYYFKGVWSRGIYADSTISTQGNAKGVFSWRNLGFYLSRLKDSISAAATMNIFDDVSLTIAGKHCTGSKNTVLTGNYFVDLGGAFLSMSLTSNMGYQGLISVGHKKCSLSTMISNLSMEKNALFAFGMQYNFYKENYVRMMLDSDLVFGIKAGAYITPAAKLSAFIRASATVLGAPAVGVKVSVIHD